MRLLSVLVLFAVAIMPVACHKGSTSPLAGEYVSARNSGSHLEIDGDTIEAGGGGVTVKFDYKTLSTEGNKSTIEMDDGHGHKDKATLTLDGDTLSVDGNFAVNGTWKRK